MADPFTFTIQEPDFEYSYDLPGGTTGLVLSNLSGQPIRYWFSEGIVADPAETAARFTVAALTSRDHGQLDLAVGARLYFASSLPGSLFTIEAVQE